MCLFSTKHFLSQNSFYGYGQEILSYLFSTQHFFILLHHVWKGIRHFRIIFIVTFSYCLTCRHFLWSAARPYDPYNIKKDCVILLTNFALKMLEPRKPKSALALPHSFEAANRSAKTENYFKDLKAKKQALKRTNWHC